MKRRDVLLAAALMLASLAGCIYETRSPQCSFEVMTHTPAQANALRALVLDFARRGGFDKEEKTGMHDYLAARDIYILSYSGKNDSFIALSNVGDRWRYTIGVYDVRGTAYATAIGRDLMRLLERHSAGTVTRLP